MNKNIKILMIMVFIVIFSSITFASDCYREGYTYCDVTHFTNWDARAESRVFWSFEDINGNMVGDDGIFPETYAIGVLRARVGFEGDKLYEYKNLPTWNSISCTSTGCAGTEISAGVRTLATIGQEFLACTAYVAWDYDSNNGWWAYSRAAIGWPADVGGCPTIRVVECSVDSDCLSTQYCGNSGSWESWTCNTKECTTGQTKCEETDYFVCSNNEWSSQGVEINKCGVECFGGDEKCMGLNHYTCNPASYICINDGIERGECGVDCVSVDEKCEGVEYNTCSAYEWVNEGIVIDECGVECLESKCEGNDYVSCNSNVFENEGITLGQCEIDCIYNEDCDYECSNGKCIEKVFDYKYLIYGASGVLILILMVFWIIKRK